MSSFRFNVVTLPLALLTAVCGALLAQAVVRDYHNIESRALESAVLIMRELETTLAPRISAEDPNVFQSLHDHGLFPAGIARFRAYNAEGTLVAVARNNEAERWAWTPVLTWLSKRGVLPEEAPPIMRPILDSEGVQVGTLIVDMGIYAAFGRSVQSWFGIVLACFIAIGLYALRASAFARRRIRHVDALGEFARNIRDGHASRHLKLEGPPEFALLQDALNELSDAKRARVASQRFIGNVLESMPDSLIVVNPDSTIRSVNKATLELLEYDEHELTGRQFSIICSADGQHLTCDRLDEFLGSGARRDTEVIYTSKTGERIPVSLSGSAILGPHGRGTGYVCIGTDIRPRKRADAEQQTLHKKILQTSHQAGMAEVATSVLHNVGNVLNSVNVSATLIADRLRDNEVKRLTKAAALLKEHEHDLVKFLTEDDRGHALPGYFVMLAEQMDANQRHLLDEVESLTQNVGHIKSIVSAQQQLSKSSSLIETISPSELLGDALRMSEKIADLSHIRLIRRFDRVPDLSTDRHRVIQILVNLIRNAVSAMADCKPGKATLTVSLCPKPDDSGFARIQISDTGHGIDPSMQAKIFTLGFTTKKDGHGFGLHSAALAAKELGGSLEMHSDGPGCGATFIFDLPLAHTTVSEAA
ncbi:MAG: PAS domain S-box protein [Planctomycetes bacterium]|nr:PAS domain S-box protein [Planctomycetota bacterium]